MIGRLPSTGAGAASFPVSTSPCSTTDVRAFTANAVRMNSVAVVLAPKKTISAVIMGCYSANGIPAGKTPHFCEFATANRAKPSSSLIKPVIPASAI